MLLYSRYISNKILVGFAGLTTILISLIWFSRAIGFMTYVTENGIELSKFFYLFILIIPWILLFIIPISLFAAILLVYNRLLITNEITILKNSGLNKFSICKPAIPAITIAAILSFVVSFYFMPYANKEMRNLRNDLKNNYTNLSFTPGTFETLKNLTIYAKQRDENNRLSGILLHEEKSTKSSLTITAKSGNIGKESDATLLYMENGTIQKYNYLTEKSEILHFDNYVFNLTENQTGATNMRWKPKERYFSELLFPEKDASSEDLAKNRAEINRRITNPFLPIILSMIALSCILHGTFSRRGNFSNIVIAIVQASVFMVSTILIYELIESSANYIFLLYLDFVAFFVIALKLLSEKYKLK